MLIRRKGHSRQLPPFASPRTVRPFWRGLRSSIRSNRSLYRFGIHGSLYMYFIPNPPPGACADFHLVLWRSSGTCENYGILTGHKQAILDLHWSRDSKVLFSASADMQLASWDVETGERIRRHPGHEEVINCMDVSKRGEEMLVSGSDDGYIGVSTYNTRPLDCSDCVDSFGILGRKKP